jgi:hypothetical protein
MRKIFVVFILIAFISCSKQRIIPENILAEIIYEMQIADVVLVAHESSIRYRDSMRIYEPLIEKFGYNFDDLRKSFLKYTENGKLQSVLKKVIKRIEDEKDIYKEPARIEKLSENMNVGADSVFLQSRTVNKQNIEVRLSEKGVYDISAGYFFFKNDSTKNPKMRVWLESSIHKDSVMERQEISLIKDTVFTDYLLRVRFNDPDFNILKIYWIDFEQKPDSQKAEIATSSPSKPVRLVDSRITNPKQKTNVKIKPDITTRQHLIIRRKSVKYNFEESDTTKLKEEFIGPLLPDSLDKSKVTDSIKNTVDTVERIIAIKRKDSVNYGK